MGGCYDSDRYTYTSRQSSKSTDLKKAFREFLKSQDKSVLITAYQGLVADGNEQGFIKKLHDYQNLKTAPKECDEYELEAKFAIQLTGQGKEPTIEQILDGLDLQPTKGCTFLKDPVNAISTGTNTFYGTTEGEERLVIICKGGNYYKKEKGHVEPFSYGLPLEQFILKRYETRIPTTPDEIAQAILRLNQDGKLTRAGTIEKTKGDFFLLNLNTGREYGCTVSDAKLLDGREGRQVQLEMEYAGFIPGFSGLQKGDERQIVEEMIHLYSTLLMSYGLNSVPLNAGYSMKLLPTQERKYDFVSGNEIALSTSVQELTGVHDVLLLETPPVKARRRRVRA
ncbi:MAG: hypothetical protein V1725_01370 [archaeon]